MDLTIFFLPFECIDHILMYMNPIDFISFFEVLIQDRRYGSRFSRRNIKNLTLDKTKILDQLSEKYRKFKNSLLSADRILGILFPQFKVIDQENRSRIKTLVSRCQKLKNFKNFDLIHLDQLVGIDFLEKYLESLGIGACDVNETQCQILDINRRRLELLKYLSNKLDPNDQMVDFLIHLPVIGKSEENLLNFQEEMLRLVFTIGMNLKIFMTFNNEEIEFSRIIPSKKEQMIMPNLYRDIEIAFLDLTSIFDFKYSDIEYERIFPRLIEIVEKFEGEFIGYQYHPTKKFEMKIVKYNPWNSYIVDRFIEKCKDESLKDSSPYSFKWFLNLVETKKREFESDLKEQSILNLHVMKEEECIDIYIEPRNEEEENLMLTKALFLSRREENEVLEMMIELSRREFENDQKQKEISNYYHSQLENKDLNPYLTWINNLGN